MIRETVSVRQGQSILILFILGTTLALPVGKEAGGDIWLSFIIAVSFALIFNIIYARILTIYTDKNLFEISILLFGEVFGKLIITLYIWYALYTGALVLRLYGEFVLTISLPETPMYAVIILMSIFTIWIVKQGIEVIGRCSLVFIVINIIIPPIILLFLINQINLDHMRPFLYNGFKPVLSGAFTIFSFPLTQTVILTMAFTTFRLKKSTYRVFTLGMLLAAVIAFMTIIIGTLVMGVELNNATFFPYTNVADKITVSELLDNLSVIILMTALITGFIKASICLIASVNGIARLFNFRSYRFLVVPMGAVMCSLAFFAHENLIAMQKWANEVYPYYQFPFQVILPLLILIVAEFKNKK